MNEKEELYKRFQDIIEKLLVGEQLEVHEKDISFLLEAIATHLFSNTGARNSVYFDGAVNLTAKIRKKRQIEIRGEMWVGNHKEQWKEKLIATVTDRTATGHGFSIIMQVGNDRVEEDVIVCKKTALSDKELELKEMNMNKINDESFIEPAGIIIDSDSYGNYIYRVHVNGIGIGYKLIGRGEPLVMILGLGGTMDCWPQEVIRRLSEKYLLIIPDNRGMGYTTSGEETFTCKLLADDIISLLDALKVKKTHVLGFSMGSMIAQHLLLEHPERLNKVIIYATFISKSPMASEGNVPDDPAVRRQLDAILQWRTPMNKLPYVTNHVMLIVGTSDNVVGVDSSKAIASAIPGAWLIQVKNATHMLMNELPVEFSRVVLMFLDENFEVKGD